MVSPTPETKEQSPDDLWSFMGITFLIQLCGYWLFQFEDWELDFEVIKMLILIDGREWEERNVDNEVDGKIITEEK